MAFNIEQFKSITGGGFLKPSNFLLYVYPPIWALRDGGANKWDGPDLAYLAASSALPGLQVFTTESKIYGQGPTVKMPYDITPTDMTVRFYADSSGKSIAFFYDWLRNIVNLSHTQDQPRAGAFSNQLSYRADYTTKIDIMLFNDRPRTNQGDPQDSALMIFSLHDAFPLSIAETTLDWQSGNEIMTFNVTFAFTSFEYKILGEPRAPESTKLGGRLTAGRAGTLQEPDLQLYDPGPVNLSDLAPQPISPAAKPTPLEKLNQFATNVRERSTKVRTEAVSTVRQVESMIYNNQYVQTAQNLVGAAKDIKKTLGVLKGLNASLKNDLKQEFRTMTSKTSLKNLF